MTRIRTTAATMAIAVAAGAAITAPAMGASTPIGPPPLTCAGVPTAQDDPALATVPPAPWLIPPGGTCATIERPDGSGAIELRYPDGRLWAEWVVVPDERGRTFHYPDGTTLIVGPGLRPDLSSLQRIRLSASTQRVLVRGSSPARATARCAPRTPVIRVRPGQRVVIHPVNARRPIRVSVGSAQKPRASRAVAITNRPGARWVARWTAPPRVTGGDLTITLHQQNGTKVAFRACARVVR